MVTAFIAFSLASRAWRALLVTMLESCSMAADVPSMLAACLVVRSERSPAPCMISSVAVLRLRDVV